MRRRLRPIREHGMARRMAEDGGVSLSPRAMRIAGWVVAAVLIIGIAVVVGVLGGDGDGTGILPSPSGSGGAAVAEITFGTALDETTGEVADGARTNRFADGDLFVYSVPPAGTIPDAVYVEVRRTDGGPAEVVQPPVDAQGLGNPAVIAFTVPTAELLAAFGAGEFVMLIYADPAGAPIAEGTFQLVAPAVSPSASP